MYPTVLDGTDSAYHVVTGSGTNYTAVLQGFTIQGGNASGDGTNADDSYFGGGLLIDGGSPTISDCTFTANGAVSGGAIYIANQGADFATVQNCAFTSNTATASGGSIYIVSTSPILLDDQFLTNSAPFAGAIYNSSSNDMLVNCLFASNSTPGWGGAIYNYLSSPTITNCTFTANHAGEYGGAIENDYNSMPNLTNDIFWQDTGGFGGNEISNDVVDFHGGSQPAVTYCDINGYSGNVGNFYADPLFVGSGTYPYQLAPNSPCITNPGNSNAPALPGVSVAGVSTDLAGNPRMVDSVVDLGAYEAQVVDVTWTGADDRDQLGRSGQLVR